MTHLEQALFAEMQRRRFSHGCCTVTLHLLAGNNAAAREMLLFITDGKPTEASFTEKLADVCSEYGITPEF